MNRSNRRLMKARQWMIVICTILRYEVNNEFIPCLPASAAGRVLAGRVLRRTANSSVVDRRA
jgi:hypothetical protein